MRRYTYIRMKPYYIINTAFCARTLYIAITVHQNRSSETKASDHLVPSPSLASEAASTSLSKVILEYSAPSPATKEYLSKVDSLPNTSVDHADRRHTIAIDGKTYNCKVPYAKKGLSVRRFPYVNQSTLSHIVVNTMTQNESMYTKREVEEAKQAKEHITIIKR